MPAGARGASGVLYRAKHVYSQPMPTRTTLAASALLLAATLTPAPAQAAGEGTVSMSPVVLYESCGMHPFTYQIARPASDNYWNMDFKLVGPDGIEVSTNYEYGPQVGTVQGTADFQICRYPNLPGTYTVTGTGESCPTAGSDVCTTITVAPYTVSVRLPMTRTTIKASTLRPSKGQVVRFVVKVTDERPTGYFATSSAKVQLQRKVGAAWKAVRGSATSTSRGRAVIKSRYTGGVVKVRAITKVTDELTGSTSKPVVLR